MPYAPRGVGHLRGDEPFPVAARAALANTQLRRNLGKATSHDPGQAGRGGGRAAGLGGPARGRAGDQAAHDGAPGRAPGAARTRGHRRAAGPCTGPGTPTRRAAWWSAWSGTPAPTEAVKVKSIVTDEIGLNEALAQAGIAAHETDLAELIVQLGHDRPSHILVPAIHRNRAEIREIFLREMAGVDPGLTDTPAALTEAARLYLRRRFLSARVGISGANFAVARDRHAVRGRVRGQRPDVPDPAGDADHRHGHREGDPVLARPGGVPPVPAALVHRRADEPLHLDVDRGDARATARSGSTSSCSTTGGPRRWPTRWAGRRCTASGAPRA